MLPSTPSSRSQGKMPAANSNDLKFHSASLMMNGLYTPPSSVKEGRQSSLEEFVISDNSFASSPSATSVSQPTTPLQLARQHSGSFATPWGPPHTSDLSGILDPELVCSNEQSQFHSGGKLSRGLSSGPMNGLDSMSEYQHPDPFHPLHQSPFAAFPHSRQIWPGSTGDPMSFNGPSTAVDSSTIPMSRELSLPGPAPSQILNSVHTPPPQSLQLYETPGQAGAHNQPQVIVPSQLSPNEDFSQAHLGDRVGPVDYYPGFHNGTDVDEFDVADPSGSPRDPYYITHNDEWANNDVAPQDGTTLNAPPSNSVYPPRRTTKRPRRSPMSGRADCFSRYTSLYGTDCRFEGKKFRLEGDLFNGHYTWVPEESLNPSKPHRCPHFDERGKRCPVSFDRSEHLKRHVDSKHSNERKFPCPLPSCIDKKGRERRIGRSDNASDHFKTHLRPKPKGRRNKEYDWPTVKNYILDAYDAKRATKLIDGLQRWVDAGMPEGGGAKR